MILISVQLDTSDSHPLSTFVVKVRRLLELQMSDIRWMQNGSDDRYLHLLPGDRYQLIDDEQCYRNREVEVEYRRLNEFPQAVQNNKNIEEWIEIVCLKRTNFEKCQ